MIHFPCILSPDLTVDKWRWMDGWNISRVRVLIRNDSGMLVMSFLRSIIKCPKILAPPQIYLIYKPNCWNSVLQAGRLQHKNKCVSTCVVPHWLEVSPRRILSPLMSVHVFHVFNTATCWGYECIGVAKVHFDKADTWMGQCISICAHSHVSTGETQN